VVPTIVLAGPSDVGMSFAAEFADFNFCLGEGVNTPTKCAETIGRLQKAVAKTGRKVGAYALFMVIADETDGAAEAKWECHKAGKDLDAPSWMGAQASADDRADLDGKA
jgi:pyrimidine oxygenase